MLGSENSKIFASAEKARFKPTLPIALLIFILVFVASEVISAALLLIPETVWLLSSFTPEEIISGVNDLPTPDWLIVVMLLITVSETFCAVIYCLKFEKRSAASMGFFRKNAAKEYIKGYIVGALLISAAGLAAYMLGALDVSFNKSVPVLMLFMFFIGFLVQGMAEEAIFRGYLLVSLKNSMNTKYALAIATVISSVVFAAMHLGNDGITPLAFINLVLAGVFFGVYMIKTDNIWGGCASHSAWNFFQGQIIGVQVSGISTDASLFISSPKGSEILNGGAFGLEGGICVTAVLSFAIILMLLYPKRPQAPEM